MQQDGGLGALERLAKVLDQLSGATRDLPEAIASARLALEQQPPSAPVPVADADDPLVLVIDLKTQGYAEALAMVREAYGMEPHEPGSVHVRTVPGQVIWRDEERLTIQQWNADMVRAYVDGLTPQGMLMAWRLCTTPGVAVGVADLGAFIVPDGSTKEQLTAANVAIRQGNTHARRDVEAYCGMPFTKTHEGRRNTGAARYAVDPAVAAVLLDAVRRSALYPQLCEIQPALTQQSARRVEHPLSPSDPPVPDRP